MLPCPQSAPCQILIPAARTHRRERFQFSSTSHPSLMLRGGAGGGVETATIHSPFPPQSMLPCSQTAPCQILIPAARIHRRERFQFSSTSHPSMMLRGGAGRGVETATINSPFPPQSMLPCSQTAPCQILIPAARIHRRERFQFSSTSHPSMMLRGGAGRGVETATINSPFPPQSMLPCPQSAPCQILIPAARTHRRERFQFSSTSHPTMKRRMPAIEMAGTGPGVGLKPRPFIHPSHPNPCYPAHRYAAPFQNPDSGRAEHIAENDSNFHRRVTPPRSFGEGPGVGLRPRPYVHPSHPNPCYPAHRVRLTIHAYLPADRSSEKPGFYPDKKYFPFRENGKTRNSNFIKIRYEKNITSTTKCTQKRARFRTPSIESPLRGKGPGVGVGLDTATIHSPFPPQSMLPCSQTAPYQILIPAARIHRRE